MKDLQIQTTKDYSQFVLINGNRDIRENHLKELINSMREKYCVSPIQVNEKMEVIDGQHRLQAAKTLKLPVYYYIVKGADLKTVQTLNTHTSNWETKDFLQSHIVQNSKDYKIYKEFLDTYKFSHKVNLMLLQGINYPGGTDLRNFNAESFLFITGVDVTKE